MSRSLFNIVSARKGETHPLNVFAVRTGIGMTIKPAKRSRDGWMTNADWDECRVNAFWDIVLTRTDYGTAMKVKLAGGMARVWKEGAKKACAPSMAAHVVDCANVSVVGTNEEQRAFIAKWSTDEPPCLEEVLEALINDARILEDHLTKTDFRKVFRPHTKEQCDAAWQECVQCRRQLRALLMPSEYHTLLAYSYRKSNK